MSYYFDPINILDTSNSLGLGSGGSMTISGGISVGRDTFIGGNLAISGTATSFSDNILLVNHNPNLTSDTGLLFQRYSNDITNNQNYSSIIYKESDDEFVFGYIQNDIQKELNSFSGYTALKANSLTLVSTNNSSFSENGSLNVLGGIKISKDAYLSGKMYITDSIIFNTTGNNQSNIELESSQSLYIGSNKAHIQVNGNDTLNNPGHIELAYNTYMSFNYKSNGQIENEVLRISTSGNIGIGTTSPNYKLHIQGDINFTGEIYKNGIVFSGSSQWETINSNIVYTSGNIGIGTTNPNYNLDVAGSIRTNASLIGVQNMQNGGTGRGVYWWTLIDSNWVSYMGQSGAQRSAAGGTAVAGAGFSDISIRNRSFNGNNFGFIWENSSEQLLASIRGSDGLTYFAGNVGIGTTDPTYKLDVAGNARMNGNVQMNLGSGQYLEAGGLRIAGWDTENTIYSTIGNIAISSNGGSILFKLYPNEYMRVASTGNIGIGTSSPNTKLDVNGSLNALSATIGTLLASTSFTAIGDSNTLGNLFTTNGNIGIGTTEPSSLLHVNGEIFCNSLVSPSDERLKKDIALVETENCYNLVKNIPLKQYRWNTEMHNIHVPRNDTRLGWIAQDLEESFPQSIEHFSAYGITDCRTINMDQLIAVMYGTIQELQKKVEQLEQDNSDYYLNGR